MKIQLTQNNFDTVFANLSNIVTPSIFKEYSNMFIDSVTFLGNWDNENECVSYFSKVVKNYKISKGDIELLFDKETGNVKITKGDLNIKNLTISKNTEGSSQGDGVGEISPIDSVIGSISTPNSKTKTNTSYASNGEDTHEETKQYNNTETDIEYIDYMKNINLFTMIVKELFPRLFVEFNILY